jgi:hypothetical protein
MVGESEVPGGAAWIIECERGRSGEGEDFGFGDEVRDPGPAALAQLREQEGYARDGERHEDGGQHD